MATKKVTTTMFPALLQDNRPVVIDCYADWCIPCKFAAPHFEHLSDKYGDKAVFVKVNVDKEPAIAAARRIQGVPSFFIIKDKKVMSFVVGADINKLETELRRVIAG